MCHILLNIFAASVRTYQTLKSA